MPIGYEEVFDTTAKVLARALQAEERVKQLEQKVKDVETLNGKLQLRIDELDKV